MALVHLSKCSHYQEEGWGVFRGTLLTQHAQGKSFHPCTKSPRMDCYVSWTLTCIRIQQFCCLKSKVTWFGWGTSGPLLLGLGYSTVPILRSGSPLAKAGNHLYLIKIPVPQPWMELQKNKLELQAKLLFSFLCLKNFHSSKPALHTCTFIIL